MLDNKELANVANKLQVPLIISDIMAEDELTGDMQYALHSVISDLQPDSALLGIALGGLKIANAWEKASPSLSVLKIQCESLIDEYGALWLQNAEDENVSEADAMDALSRVSEDLEGLSELLDLAIDSLQTKNEMAASLAKILSVQAKAQAVIADEFFGMLYTKMTEDCADVPKIAPAIVDQAVNNNVIPFRTKSA